MENSENSIKQNLILNLFELEKKLAVQLAAFSCTSRFAPRRIVKRFEMMTTSELEFLGKNVSNFTTCLEVAEETGTDPWDDTAFLILTMRHLGLSFSKDFLDVLAPKHVVEGYDMYRRQIFRNLHFMEVSNYSLLEVLSYDWPMLFHRDSDVTNAIIRQAEQDMWSNNRVIPAEVPVHYIRELLSDEPQICEVQQQYFAPLFSGPNNPGGILVNSSARPMGVDKSIEKNNIAFI